MKKINPIKKIMSVILCSLMAFTAVSGAGIENPVFDMAVSSYAAENELVLNKTEKDMLPYYYYTMTDTEKSNYLKIRKAILEQKSSIKLGKLTQEQVEKLFEVVYYYDDLTFNVYGYECELAPSYTRIKPRYHFNKKSYITMVNKVDKKADAIIAKFTDKTSTYAKIKYIHDYIAKYCSYNTEAQTKDTAYGALIAKKADCDGYSKAFSYICRKAGIWTVNVIGDTGEPHMWSKVYYNKKWYNIDITNNDGGESMKNSTTYKFFMISDNQISKTHSPYDCKYTIPAASDDSKNYYKMYKLQASTAAEAENLLISQIAAGASNGKNIITIQMTDDAAYSNVASYLEKNSSEAVFDILSAASKKTKAKLITNGCHSYGDADSRTYTICYYLKNKKITDYFTSLSILDQSTIDFLTEIGLEKA